MQKNNLWFSYLKERIYENKEVLDKLYKLDNSFFASNKTYNDLLKYIDSNYDKKFFDIDLNDITFLLEGSSNAFISIISDFYNKNVEVIINDDNFSVNTWINKIYNDFIQEEMIDIKLNITIDDHFKVNTKNVVVIGSNAFITEMKFCLKDKNIISYEYEE